MAFTLPRSWNQPTSEFWGSDMSFWPHYNPGDPRPNSARRENAISEVLNQHGNFSGGGGKRGIPENIRATVINLTGAKIPAGPVIALDLTEKERSKSADTPALIDETAISVRKFDPVRDAGRIFLYLEEPLDPERFGAAVVQGLFRCSKLTGSRAYDYAVPSGGTEFKRSADGIAMVVAEYDKAIIMCLGTGGGASGYNGPFKIILFNQGSSGDKASTYVAVADGATWDAEKKTSQDQPFQVNNLYKTVEAWVSKEPLKIAVWCYLVLEFSPQLKDQDGNLVQEEKIEIVQLPETAYPGGSSAKKLIYTIGRIWKDGENFRVSQEHISGVPLLPWFMTCTEAAEIHGK